MHEKKDAFFNKAIFFQAKLFVSVNALVEENETMEDILFFRKQ